MASEPKIFSSHPIENYDPECYIEIMQPTLSDKLFGKKRDHLAILDPRWKAVEKLLTGEKTAEIRFFKNKIAPWNQINPGDQIFFKNAGQLVKVRAQVNRVLSFDNLDHKKVERLLDKYQSILGFSGSDLRSFQEKNKDKKYSVLIFLEKVRATDPFTIEKESFGTKTAWIVVDSIDKLKKPGQTVQRKLFRKSRSKSS